MRSCLKFVQSDTGRNVCVWVFVCVSFSPPEPRVRYGLLPGERVGGEHWPRQECELDVHSEWQHAGETLLQRLGLLPAVSFYLKKKPRQGQPVRGNIQLWVCLRP